MTKPEAAVKWAVNIANDQSHGYSQQRRWGNPDYDCSSFCISAYKAAGVPIDTSIVNYTGNMSGLKKYGFKDVTSKVNLNTGNGLQPGDILWWHGSGTNGHTALYIGNGKIVHARGQSYGSPATGDQGTEIAVTNYSRSKWQHVLRYQGSGSVSLTENLASSITLTMAVLIEVRKGSTGTDVTILQCILTKMGITIDIDGEFGDMTEMAVRTFQQKTGLTVDGVCGRNTWKKLIGGLVT